MEKVVGEVLFPGCALSSLSPVERWRAGDLVVVVGRSADTVGCLAQVLAKGSVAQPRLMGLARVQVEGEGGSLVAVRMLRPSRAGAQQDRNKDSPRWLAAVIVWKVAELLRGGTAIDGAAVIARRRPDAADETQELHQLQQHQQRVRWISPVVLNAMRNGAFGTVADAIAFLLPFSHEARQRVLEELDVRRRLRLVVHMLSELHPHTVEADQRPSTDDPLQSIASRLGVDVDSADPLRETGRRRLPSGMTPDPLFALGDDGESEGDGDDANGTRALQRLDLSMLSAVQVKGLRAALRALPDDSRETLLRDVRRLASMPRMHPEHHLLLSYLEVVASLPWEASTLDETPPDLVDKVTRLLDKDHWGLSHVKQRIVEYVSVLALLHHRQKDRIDQAGSDTTAAAAAAPTAAPAATTTAARPRQPVTILCLVGPPGVGKTSLAYTIARALGRKCERVSLGGVRDEAAIRGHRRTYVGAMPGRIVEAIRRAGTSNPVLILDEIDKVGSGVVNTMGDPGAALLEALDPMQNSAFVDSYLSLPFNLSQVIFIATANGTDSLSPALLDRLECIYMSGYSKADKVQIADKFLVPRVLERSGLPPGALKFPDEILQYIAGHYTREAGVRGLEQQLATVCRHRAADVVRQRQQQDAVPPMIVARDFVHDALGPVRYGRPQRLEEGPNHSHVGVATGLAWTSVGGELLFIECLRYPRSASSAQVAAEGGLPPIITGRIGAVMRESVILVQTWILANAQYIVDTFVPPGSAIDSAHAFVSSVSNSCLHVHLPAGGIPKDGPSAGLALVCAMVSVFTQLPISNRTAITGEVTLRGVVLPVGGLKEKIMAAQEAGIERVLLPAGCRSDWEHLVEAHAIDTSVRPVFVTRIRDALQTVLEECPKPQIRAKQEQENANPTSAIHSRL